MTEVLGLGGGVGQDASAEGAGHKLHVQCSRQLSGCSLYGCMQSHTLSAMEFMTVANIRILNSVETPS